MPPSKPKKRANAYWRERLKRDHPAIYGRLISGDIPSVRQARKLAGIFKPPSALDDLKRAWRKAATAERTKFIDWVKGGSGKPSVGSLVNPDGYLSKKAMKMIEDALQAERASHADAMEMMGYKRLDTRLGSALRRRWKPDPAFLTKLSKWLVSS